LCGNDHFVTIVDTILPPSFHPSLSSPQSSPPIIIIIIIIITTTTTTTCHGDDDGQECIDLAMTIAEREGVSSLTTFHGADLLDPNIMCNSNSSSSSSSGNDGGDAKATLFITCGITNSSSSTTTTTTTIPSVLPNDTTIIFLYVYPTLLRRLAPLLLPLLSSSSSFPHLRAVVTLAYHFETSTDGWPPPMKVYEEGGGTKTMHVYTSDCFR